MKHWDLSPGETVTLSSGLKTVEARFLFRDTKIAAFKLESGEYREFRLRQSGSLRDGASLGQKIGYMNSHYVTKAESREALRHAAVWTIDGLDRNTRTLIAKPAGFESQRMFLARVAE